MPSNDDTLPVPSNVGTGTPYGFSGLDAAWHLQQAQLVGGRPIAVVRASSADRRRRHYGMSHHAATVLRAARCAADVPVPVGKAPTPGYAAGHAALLAEVRDLPERHRVREIPAPGLYAALADFPVALRTMGRDLAADPLSFMCAGAAGMWAASLRSA